MALGPNTEHEGVLDGTQYRKRAADRLQLQTAQTQRTKALRLNLNSRTFISDPYNVGFYMWTLRCVNYFFLFSFFCFFILFILFTSGFALPELEMPHIISIILMLGGARAANKKDATNPSPGNGLSSEQQKADIQCGVLERIVAGAWSQPNPEGGRA